MLSASQKVGSTCLVASVPESSGRPWCSAIVRTRTRNCEIVRNGNIHRMAKVIHPLVSHRAIISDATKRYAVALSPRERGTGDPDSPKWFLAGDQFENSRVATWLFSPKKSFTKTVNALKGRFGQRQSRGLD